MRPFLGDLGYHSKALFKFLNNCMVHILTIFFPNYVIDDYDNKEDEELLGDFDQISPLNFRFKSRKGKFKSFLIYLST